MVHSTEHPLEMNLDHSAKHFDDDDLLHDVQQKATAQLIKNGLSPEHAENIAADLHRELLANWGGQQVYIKKSDWGRGILSERDIELYEKFNGKNHLAIAKEYGITMQRVYEIVKFVHRNEIHKHQRHLFEDGRDTDGQQD